MSARRFRSYQVPFLNRRECCQKAYQDYVRDFDDLPKDYYGKEEEQNACGLVCRRMLGDEALFHCKAGDHVHDLDEGNDACPDPQPPANVNSRDEQQHPHGDEDDVGDGIQPLPKAAHCSRRAGNSSVKNVGESAQQVQGPEDRWGVLHERQGHGHRDPGQGDDIRDMTFHTSDAVYDQMEPAGQSLSLRRTSLSRSEERATLRS